MMDQMDVVDAVVRHVKATKNVVAECRSHRWKAQYGRQQSVSSASVRAKSGMHGEPLERLEFQGYSTWDGFAAMTQPQPVTT